MSHYPEPQKYFDNSILYIDSGVANSFQISSCLKIAIAQAEKILGRPTNCRFKINLLVNKEGEYFGYGYIWISSPEIYWMLLGKNPDGSERIEEYPDPDWKPPVREKKENLSGKKWTDLIEEEDAYVQPMIKKVLPPLVTFPGYLYEPDQIAHLKELKMSEMQDKLQQDKSIGDKSTGDKSTEIPPMGYFEISRGYAIDAPPGTLRHRLCARNVPNWIPAEVFKTIFSFYLSDRNGKYPIVNFVDSKKGGRNVFITFDPTKKDAIFTLLMTKKTVMINPKNPKQTVTLIFSHAFEKT